MKRQEQEHKNIPNHNRIKMPRHNRRIASLALVFLAALSMPAHADRVLYGKVEGYKKLGAIGYIQDSRTVSYYIGKGLRLVNIQLRGCHAMFYPDNYDSTNEFYRTDREIHDTGCRIDGIRYDAETGRVTFRSWVKLRDRLMNTPYSWRVDFSILMLL